MTRHILRPADITGGFPAALLRDGRAAGIWLVLSFAVFVGVSDAAASAAGEAQFFVAHDGSDEWSGTLPVARADRSDGPLASLAGARDVVRRWKARHPEEDIVVSIRGGRYFLEETVVFGLEDSGSARQRITYAAQPGEEPVFSGGVRLTGWQKVSPVHPDLPAEARDHVWVADVPTRLGRFFTLFSEGKMLPRARGPAFLPAKRHAYEHDPGCGNVSRPEDRWMLRHIDFPSDTIKNRPNLKDVEICFMPVFYSMNILPLASVDESAGVATLAIEATAPPFSLIDGWLRWKESMWVENVLEHLDEPGEWVLDTQNRRLYLWPKEEAPGQDIFAPGLCELIRVEGRIDYEGPTDTPVRNLTFRGLTFTHGDRRPWERDWKGWGLQHDWELFDRPTAMVRFRGAEDCTVEECRFTNSGGTALRLDLHCQRVTVARNLIDHVGGMGILLCGYGPGTKDVHRDNRIISNHIHHCGEIRWDAHAIMVWQSGGNRVAHNLIHDCPRKAIAISGVRHPSFDRDRACPESYRTIRWHELPPHVSEGTDWRRVIPFLHARDNVIEYNEVYRVLGKLGDGAAINVSGAGEGNVIRRNYVHHIVNPASFGSMIRTDGWQSGTTIRENILYKSAIHAFQRKNLNPIENNIVVDVNPRRGFVMFDTFPDDAPVSGVRVRYNIFYQPGRRARFYGDASERLGKVSNPPAACVCDHNLFYTAADPAFSREFLSTRRKEGIEQHSVAEDPLLANIAAGDFRLKPGSPALAMGFKPFDAGGIGLLPATPERFARHGIVEDRNAESNRRR